MTVGPDFLSALQSETTSKMEDNMTLETQTDSVVLSKWGELKTLVETLEEDVTKNASGNAAAGVRARKGLRTLKQTTADLVKRQVK